jgi:hypothetical protein
MEVQAFSHVLPVLLSDPEVFTYHTAAETSDMPKKGNKTRNRMKGLIKFMGDNDGLD